jgi:hypothetical protein
VTICPCCGAKSNTGITRVWSEGCRACGARPVGEPLPRPEHELPSYARSLVLAVTGTLMVLVFLAQTVGSFAQNLPTYKTTRETIYAAGVVAFDYLAWLAAAQTAAWRLKWVAIPLTLLVVFGSRKLYRSIKESPSRFCGLRYARRGYIASTAVPLLILVLIGISVPKRLEEHQMGLEAGIMAQGYRIDRALIEYREQFGTLPGELKDLNRLHDADGSLAVALKDLDASGYEAVAEVASVPKKKPQPLRGAVISNASFGSNPASDGLSEGLAFTNYELRLPGPDKLSGTEDDLIFRDGYKASDTPRRPGSTSVSTQTTK